MSVKPPPRHTEAVGTPCAHPRCKDAEGNPYLTPDGMCHGCQRRIRDTIWHLVLDWLELKTRFPSPRRMEGAERRSAHRTYGHPAEWASDKATEIADKLNWTHDALADHLGESPPPRPGASDRIRVSAAWKYLECRIDKFAKWEFAKDQAAELIDLHGEIRSKLGYTRPRQLLPIPCPRCELKTVSRQVDYGIDHVQCESCGYVTDQRHYDFLTRMLLDNIIADQAQKESEVTPDTPR